MPIDRGQIFLDVCSEMIAEWRAEIRIRNERVVDINLELLVLDRLKNGESAAQIVATGNKAIHNAIGRIAGTSSGLIKGTPKETNA